MVRIRLGFGDGLLDGEIDRLQIMAIAGLQ